MTTQAQVTEQARIDALNYERAKIEAQEAAEIAAFDAHMESRAFGPPVDDYGFPLDEKWNALFF